MSILTRILTVKIPRDSPKQTSIAKSKRFEIIQVAVGQSAAPWRNGPDKFAVAISLDFGTLTTNTIFRVRETATGNIVETVGGGLIASGAVTQAVPAQTITDVDTLDTTATSLANNTFTIAAYNASLTGFQSVRTSPSKRPLIPPNYEIFIASGAASNFALIALCETVDDALSIS